MVTHASLTGAELHEPKGVATAGSNTFYKANGSGSGSWSALDYSVFPAGTQIGFAYNAGSYPTLTGTIPTDGTIPQNTEGTEIMTCAYTPKAANSLLKIEVFVPLTGFTNSQGLVAALFKDSTANALCAAVNIVNDGNFPYGNYCSVHMTHVESAGSTAARTYKVRAAGNKGNTPSIGNGFGGADYPRITITEIRQ